MAFDAPNYTQFPNALIALMPQMGESELKITLAIARKTFGWHKDEDKLSLTQLEKLTGLSRQGVIDGIDKGMERGTIARRESGNSFVYWLVIIEPVNEIDQSTELTSDSQQSRPELVNKVDTQKKKESKETTTAADGNIFSQYENLGLLMNPTIAEQLKEAEQEYPQEWIKEAFGRAAAANIRKWSYIRGILENWKTAGHMDYPTKKEEFVRPSAPAVNTAPKWVST